MSTSAGQTLNLAPSLSDPDGFYEALIDAHQDLDAEQSGMLNAQLILLLSNHIGNLPVLREALMLARNNVSKPESSKPGSGLQTCI